MRRALFTSVLAFASFTAASASADASSWARPLTLSAGLGYAAPAGTVAAEVEWLPMPILALAGAVGTDGEHTNGAAALRLQIPSDSIAIGLGLGGAIDALTLSGPEATRMRELIDALENLDDVQDVYTTAVID